MIEIHIVNNRLPCFVSIPMVIKGVLMPETKGFIDTGCQYTRISINELCKFYTDPMLLKDNDISEYRRGNLSISRTIGVNDSAKYEDISLLSDDELFRRKDIGFRHSVNWLKVNGVSLGKQDVVFAYAYNSPTLIGMNVLKQFNWSYDNGVFRLSSKDGSDRRNIFKCMSRMRKLIFEDNLFICDVKKALSYEFSSDCIDKALSQVLENTYYEGG